jgi:hypothetical protein
MQFYFFQNIYLNLDSFKKLNQKKEQNIFASKFDQILIKIYLK